jgi:hypothetical protein
MNSALERKVRIGRLDIRMLGDGRVHVGLAEAVAFEEKRFAGGFGQGVREAIAEVKCGRVAALAVIGISLPGDVRLLFGDRFDGDMGSAKKRVALT